MEVALERDLRERERKEAQALREAAARAGAEERMQAAVSKRLEKERHVQAAMEQRLAHEAQARERAQRREAATLELALLRDARRALEAMQPRRLPLAAILVALAGGIGIYAITRAPQPATAPAGTGEPLSLRLDRNVEALATRPDTASIQRK